MPHTKRQLKESAILQAAEKVIAHKGYTHTRMDDLAAELSMTKAGLYFYFKNKEELYLAVTFRAFQSLIDSYYSTIQNFKESTGADRVLSLAACYLDFSERYHYYHEAMFHYMSLIRGTQQGVTSLEEVSQSVYWRRIQDVHHLPMNIFVTEIKSGIVDGSIDQQTPAEVIYLNIWALVAGYIKINIFGKRASKTIYRVEHDVWRAGVLQQVERMCKPI